MTFASTLEGLSEQERYVLEERAAIIQYHGGKSRAEAEADAMEQYDANSQTS